MNAYLLGLATIPAALGACWLLWQAYQLAAKALRDLFRRVPLGKATNRALFAAGAASARRVYVFDVFGVSVAFIVGWDPSKAEEIYRAVYAAIAPKAKVNVRRPDADAPAGQEA